MQINPPIPYDLCVGVPISRRRFQPGEGPSRGLLRDYEPSDRIRMELFEALVFTPQQEQDGRRYQATIATSSSRRKCSHNDAAIFTAHSNFWMCAPHEHCTAHARCKCCVNPLILTWVHWASAGAGAGAHAHNITVNHFSLLAPHSSLQ